MSILFAIVIFAALLGIVLTSSVAFILVSLSRSSRLIAARAGRVPIEAFVVQPPRRHRTVRFVQRRSAPLLAMSRDLLREIF
ncbi:hypothetical protein [Bradyrhizobium prioriisuperbiae]|uniref:hypothetical protein n=1 Tax=Bradyrhizobium prioriisuperbiae TaxID=2854389 RepID=UPI0028ED0F95|nr:hypothetical protein [Bradyrhizobium prioritasuperba]